MFLSVIDIIILSQLLLHTSLIPNYLFIWLKDKTYSPVTLFVPVLVILVYMFTLIYVRMGKDRKDIDKDQTLYYVYIIFT